MSNTTPIPFHFLDSKLCDRFLENLSVELLVRLLRDSTAGQKVLFPGFRITPENFRTPALQKKLRGQLIQFRGLRILLCRSWLFAQESALELHLRKVLISLGSQEGALISQLEELQHLIDPLEIATTLIHSLIWTEVPIDDIRILISVVNSDCPNQEELSNHVERLIQSSKDDPSRFVERVQRSVEAAERRVEQYKKEKTALLTERTEYEDKLKECGKSLKEELLVIQGEVSALLSRKEEESKIKSELENQLRELEVAHQRTAEEKSEQQRRQRRAIEKVGYEKTQLENEIQAIAQKEKDLELVVKNAINHQEKAQDNLNRVQQVASTHTAKKKDHGPKQTPIVRASKTKSGQSTEGLEAWVAGVQRLIAAPVPVRANEIGFIATPVSLMALDQMALSRSEEKAGAGPQEQQWANEELTIFAQRKSKELFQEDRQLAAEIALSGIFHSLRAENTALVDRQVLSFLNVLSGQSPEDTSGDSAEGALRQSLGACLQQWKRAPLVSLYLGRLSLLFFDQFQSLFDISEQRDRLGMKQVLTTCFGSRLGFEERDPSHEILHLIATEYERRESVVRSASRRWLAQPSLDSIAQNARNPFLASIFKLFQLTGGDPESQKANLETGVSKPLSTVLKQQRPSALEGLVKECAQYMRALMRTPEWVACAYVWPCAFHLLEVAMTAGVEAKRSFRALLEVQLEKQYHPLKVSGRNCPVQISISNGGNSEARNVRMLIMSTELDSQVGISDAEPQFESIKPGTDAIHEFSIKCPASTEVCELEYLMQWTDESEFERSSSGILKLLSQRQIDWTKAQNPYSLKSIRDPARLKGRRDKLDILRRSWDSMDSYCITGQRRTGKSSVARVCQLELHTNKQFAAIYLQWGDLGTDELPAICHNICCEMAELVAERYGTKEPAPPAMESFLGNEGFVTASFFSRLNRRLSDCRLFIIIDDFDELPLRLVESDTGDQLFTILRSLMSKGFLALYLVGGEKVPEILKRQGERLNIMHRCDIDYLKIGEGIGALVTDPAEGILEFDDEAVEEVVRWSAGNPYYATLICGRLFNDMARAEDYFVSRRDVRNTLNTLLEEDTLSNYQHFWKDGVFLPGKLGHRQQYHNAKALIALARAECAEGDAISREKLLQRDDLGPLGKNDVEYAIDGLLTRKVITQEDDRLSIRVPLLSRWLSGNNARTVEQSFAEADLIEAASAYPRGITAGEIVTVVQDLSYQSRSLNEIQVEDWLSQFGDITVQRIAYKLLNRLRESGYFNVASMFTAFKQLHQIIKSTEAESRGFAVKSKSGKMTNVLLSYLGMSGKSGSSCQYSYRQANKIHSACAVSPEQLLETLSHSDDPKLVVFPDDIIGSGRTCIEAFRQFQEEMRRREINAEQHIFYLVSVVATEEGQKAIEDAFGGALTVLVWKQLEQVDRAFSKKAKIFDSETQRIEAHQLVEEIGKELEPKHPLGWQNGQLLVTFEHSCPNNTLPIFYKRAGTYRGKEWRPLFPR